MAQREGCAKCVPGGFCPYHGEYLIQGSKGSSTEALKTIQNYTPAEDYQAKSRIYGVKSIPIDTIQDRWTNHPNIKNPCKEIAQERARLYEIVLTALVTLYPGFKGSREAAGTWIAESGHCVEELHARFSKEMAYYSVYDQKPSVEIPVTLTNFQQGVIKKHLKPISFDDRTLGKINANRPTKITIDYLDGSRTEINAENVQLKEFGSEFQVIGRVASEPLASKGKNS